MDCHRSRQSHIHRRPGSLRQIRLPGQCGQTRSLSQSRQRFGRHHRNHTRPPIRWLGFQHLRVRRPAVSLPARRFQVQVTVTRRPAPTSQVAVRIVRTEVFDFGLFCSYSTSQILNTLGRTTRAKRNNRASRTVVVGERQVPLGVGSKFWLLLG